MKYSYKRPLCPAYDLEAVEQWLSAQSQKGLHLTSNGYVFHLFEFQKGQPQSVRYRLVPNGNFSALDILPEDAPLEDEAALYREYGWEYWGPYLDFSIYRTENPQARELHTDPAVRAMGLEPVRKRLIGVLLLLAAMLAAVVLGLLTGPVKTAGKESLTTALIPCALLALSMLPRKEGAKTKLLRRGAMALLLGYVLYSLFSAMRRVALVKRIVEGDGLSLLVLLVLLLAVILVAAEKYRRIRQIQQGHGGKGKLWWLPMIPMLLLLIRPWVPSHNPTWDAVPLEDFHREVPFVTLAELAPEREYIPQGGTAVQWSSPLSLVNYKWVEEACLDGADGTRWGGGLTVWWYETRNETIARRLARELAVNLTNPVGNPTEELTIYQGIHPSVLMRRGNTVIQVYFTVQSWGDHVSQLPLWLEKMQQRHG